jgi:hypothetical protein
MFIRISMSFFFLINIRISMSCEVLSCLRYFRLIPCRIYVRVNVATIFQAKLRCRQGISLGNDKTSGALVLHHSTNCTSYELPNPINRDIAKYNFTFHQIWVQRICEAPTAILQKKVSFFYYHVGMTFVQLF